MEKPEIPKEWYSYIGKKGRKNQFKDKAQEIEHMLKMNKNRWKPRLKIDKENEVERKADKYPLKIEEEVPA